MAAALLLGSFGPVNFSFIVAAPPVATFTATNSDDDACHDACHDASDEEDVSPPVLFPIDAIAPPVATIAAACIPGFCVWAVKHDGHVVLSFSSVWPQET